MWFFNFFRKDETEAEIRKQEILKHTNKLLFTRFSMSYTTATASEIIKAKTRLKVILYWTSESNNTIESNLWNQR